jgi:hypothetical protein
MPGRAGGSRGSAPSTPHLNEARPAAISSEGLSGRRGAPTGAKVRVVTLAIFLMFLTKIFKIFFFVETLLLINPYKQYNQKIFRLTSWDIGPPSTCVSLNLLDAPFLSADHEQLLRGE